MFTVAEIQIMCDEILMDGHGVTAQKLHALPEEEIIKLYIACIERTNNHACHRTEPESGSCASGYAR